MRPQAEFELQLDATAERSSVQAQGVAYALRLELATHRNLRRGLRYEALSLLVHAMARHCREITCLLKVFAVNMMVGVNIGPLSRV